MASGTLEMFYDPDTSTVRIYPAGGGVGAPSLDLPKSACADMALLFLALCCDQGGHVLRREDVLDEPYEVPGAFGTLTDAP